MDEKEAEARPLMGTIFLVLVHTVQLKPMIKAQISERMVSNGIIDVATALVHSEITNLKKLMMNYDDYYYYYYNRKNLLVNEKRRYRNG